MTATPRQTGVPSSRVAGRSAQPWLTCLCGASLLSGAGLAAAPAASDHQDALDRITASCSAYIPADARTVDSFRLCQSDHGGGGKLYACAQFVAAKGNYRALFNGGRHPQAIARLRTNGAVDELLWHAAERSNPPTCDFPAPPRLPTGTTFVGVGVCQDEEAQSVPCAVFRDKSSQRVTIVDHLVLYRADGLGPFHTTTIHLGVNEDAAPARLAFQIGLELLKTSCCQRRGLKYIEHAYRLFPRSLVYRSAYQHYRRQTLDGTPVAHWRAHDEETH